MNYKHRVNWVDGMKINKDHFIGFEDAMMQQFASIQSSYVHHNNYGLIPGIENQDKSVDLTVSIDGQESIHVVINRCMAVTLGGYQITINDKVNDYLSQSGQLIKNEFDFLKTEGAYYVVVSVNPYNRVSIGYADPNETPARKPYVISGYQISLQPESQVQNHEIGENSMVLAKVISDGSHVDLVDDFIPPCTSMQSHPDLNHAYNEIGSFFNSIEFYCTSVIQKIHQKKQTNELAKMVRVLALDILTYLRGAIPTYRINDKYGSPVEMIIKLMSLARTIKGSLDLHAGTGKENLLNYLTNWCDVNQGAFENVLDEMIHLEYVHHDVNEALQKVTSFTALMNALFKKLNELEYIGKKSDSNIFVKEDVVTQEPVKKRRRFFME
ncbi:hypothetical protein F6U93_12885 [Tamlana haliotis]|uniref:Type VI secretion system baseplate subunit TssK n=1 Tax=Pseudotamlana haliotis TaxID=2614804 RepID=A0A6N6MC85_9FLAO|nr:hypothetical protein [Tamlana haliotis]KAB1067301.1 hypothetical protein F6U93_12885 [Tamlana haliotis]